MSSSRFEDRKKLRTLFVRFLPNREPANEAKELSIATLSCCHLISGRERKWFRGNLVNDLSLCAADAEYWTTEIAIYGKEIPRQEN